MLFPYTYVPHKMDRMQRFINFIFYQVWCRAPKCGVFRLELFNPNSDLKEVMTAFYYSDKQNAYFFYGHVERIYGLFAQLPRMDIKQFKRWFQGNNSIEKVCSKDPNTHLARYEDIPPKHKDLREELETFFKGLYDNIEIAALKNIIGNIDDHYKAFMGVNKAGKCPFCGINDVLGVNHTPREAYDHYLPKALYPFNSINFHNLVPACHHCNSSYKTSKNPAFTPKDPTKSTHRRKVFYPYASAGYSIDVTIELKSLDLDHLKPEEVELQFGPPAIGEEIETWKDVYGIEERYKDKCLSPDAKDWLEQVRILNRNHGITHNAIIKTIAEQAENSPFSNSNFLKTAFLDGCERAGLFDALPAN